MDSPQTSPLTGTGSTQQGSSRSFQTFGQYSQFLRAAVADEESLQIGESLQAMAAHIEGIVAQLAVPVGEAGPLVDALLALLDSIRSHRTLLQELGDDWQHRFEFVAHVATLNHFRTLVTQWVAEAGPPAERRPGGDEFELVAWRLLGDGAMLLDMYDQSGARSPDPLSEPPSRRRGLRAAWAWLRTVLHFPS